MIGEELIEDIENRRLIEIKIENKKSKGDGKEVKLMENGIERRMIGRNLIEEKEKN